MEPSTSAALRPNELNTKEVVQHSSVIQFVNPSWELSPTFDTKLEENENIKAAHHLESRIDNVTSDTSSESSDSDSESTSSSSSSDSSTSSSSSDSSSNSDNSHNEQYNSKKTQGEKNSKGR